MTNEERLANVATYYSLLMDLQEQQLAIQNKTMKIVCELVTLLT